MTDREKVVRALEMCEKKDCILCPYIDWRGEYDDCFYDCTTLLAKDALSLLKEQKIVRCKDCKHGRLYAPNCVDCEHIKMAIDADWFCADGERK